MGEKEDQANQLLNEATNQRIESLTRRVDAMQGSLDRNHEVASAMREDLARMRGELNGTLPRIDRNVEKLFELLDGQRESFREYHEKTRVHEREIGLLFKGLNGKADEDKNEDAHAKLWLFVKASLVALATGAISVSIAKLVGW